MAHNPQDEAWLEGVRARVAGKNRDSCPYGKAATIHSADISNAMNWYGGYEVADVILGVHNAKEPA